MPKSSAKQPNFKEVLDKLDKVPDATRMSGPEIKFFQMLSTSLIIGENFHSRASRPAKFTNPALKTAFTKLETLADNIKRPITRKQALELWDFSGDMALDGEVDSDSDCSDSSHSSDSEEETPPPKPRGRPKGSKNKDKSESESDSDSD